MKSPARHAGVAHAELHDGLLHAADLVQVLAQLHDQRVEHARRQAQLHELVGEPLAQPRGLRVASTLLVERLDDLRLQLRERGEPARGFLRVGAGLDLLLVLGLVLVAVLDLLVNGRLGRELRVDRLGDHVGRIRVVEADDEVDQPALARLDGLVGPQHEIVGRRIGRERPAHGVEAFLDALGDRDLALAGQQFHRAHLAHVHAHRVGRAAELGVDGGGERCRGFLGGFVVGHDRLAQQQCFGIRRLLVHRNAHVVDHLHDVFDLLRIDDLGGQVIVDLGVGQEALFLAARDQELELRLPVLRRGGRQTDLELLGAGLGTLGGLAKRRSHRGVVLLRVAGSDGRRDLRCNAGLGHRGALGRHSFGRLRGERRCPCAALASSPPSTGA